MHWASHTLGTPVPRSSPRAVGDPEKSSLQHPSGSGQQPGLQRAQGSGQKKSQTLSQETAAAPSLSWEQGPRLCGNSCLALGDFPPLALVLWTQGPRSPFTVTYLLLPLKGQRKPRQAYVPGVHAHGQSCHWPLPGSSPGLRCICEQCEWAPRNPRRLGFLPSGSDMSWAWRGRVLTAQDLGSILGQMTCTQPTVSDRCARNRQRLCRPLGPGGAPSSRQWRHGAGAVGVALEATSDLPGQSGPGKTSLWCSSPPPGFQGRAQHPGRGHSGVPLGVAEGGSPEPCRRTHYPVSGEGGGEGRDRPGPLRSL